MFKFNAKVVTKDRGAAEHMRVLDSLSRTRNSVSAGVFDDGLTYVDSDNQVVEIALLMEFGDGKNIPSRSFVRSWFDENADIIKRFTSQGMRLVAKGKLSEKDLMDKLGAWMVSGIVSKINSSVPPPNADSTVKKKGHGVTLLDTGLLRSAVKYKVLKR